MLNWIKRKIKEDEQHCCDHTSLNIGSLLVDISERTTECGCVTEYEKKCARCERVVKQIKFNFKV